MNQLTLSVADDVGGRVDVVAESVDDEAVQLRVSRRQDVEADDLGFGEGRIASNDDQHLSEV